MNKPLHSHIMENYKARKINGLEPQTTQEKHTRLKETANPNRQCKTHTFIYMSKGNTLSVYI